MCYKRGMRLEAKRDASPGKCSENDRELKRSNVLWQTEMPGRRLNIGGARRQPPTRKDGASAGKIALHRDVWYTRQLFTFGNDDLRLLGYEYLSR